MTKKNFFIATVVVIVGIGLVVANNQGWVSLSKKDTIKKSINVQGKEDPAKKIDKEVDLQREIDRLKKELAENKTAQPPANRITKPKKGGGGM